MKTIEEELINALYKAEAITEDAKACLGKVSDDSQLSTVFYSSNLPTYDEIVMKNMEELFRQNKGNSCPHLHEEITFNKLSS